MSSRIDVPMDVTDRRQHKKNCEDCGEPTTVSCKKKEEGLVYTWICTRCDHAMTRHDKDKEESNQMASRIVDNSTDKSFVELSQIDVSKHIEKKGKFSYLSWPYAVSALREHCPGAVWKTKYFDGKPYCLSDGGCFVHVDLILAKDQVFGHTHPVLDNKNIPILKPNAFQINTSLQRCLVKVIAMATGIGLFIYAGEDLPLSPPEPVRAQELAWVSEFCNDKGYQDHSDFMRHYGITREMDSRLFKQIKAQILADDAANKKNADTP